MFAVAALARALIGCASRPAPTDGGPDRADVPVADDVALDLPAIADTGPDDVTADVPADAPGDGAVGCLRGVLTPVILACIDGGRGPRACLAEALAAHPGVPCDDDHDTLEDDLEDALAQGYSLAFAYNHGDGSHTLGNPEPHWPDSFAHFVAGSQLMWRMDGDTSTQVLVDAAPSVTTFDAASIVTGGVTHRASLPGTTDGGDFWLCLRQPGGSYPVAAMVTSMDASRTLPGGLDVASVVHAAGGVSGTASYAFVVTMLFYPYNEHSLVDDHEGDWEGGGVLVDLDAGNVVALYLDRHASADSTRLLPLVGPGAVRAVDPSAESPVGNVCSDADAAPALGVRFWDYAGRRHHAVAYVSTGGHAAYPYPGNTRIAGVGCIEITIVRDTHNGDGARFLPWLGAFASGWTDTPSSTVVDGVHFRNAGETVAPREPWAAYRGQWGCQQGTIASSWPGPFGNQRHCRAWVTTGGWGAPPFTVPTAGCP